MVRKFLSVSLGTVFVWGLAISAWGYCGPQPVESAAIDQETQIIQGNEIKEAHHPCHSLKDPYVVTSFRDFVQPVSPQSLLKDIHHPALVLSDGDLSHASGSPPPLDGSPPGSIPLFQLNLVLRI